MEWVASRVKKAPGSESGLSLVIDYRSAPRAIKKSILEAETPISTSEKLWSSHAQQYRISCTHQENPFFVMAFFIPPSCKFWMFVSRRMPSKSLLVASPYRMAFSLCLWESCPPPSRSPSSACSSWLEDLVLKQNRMGRLIKKGGLTNVDIK